MNNKKKIFIVTQPEVVDTIGGAITVFVDFCNMLQSNGYDVTGFCYAEPNNRPQNLSDECKFVNLNHYFPHKSYKEAINTYFEQDKPDLIIFFFKFLYDKACLSKNFDNIPRILMFHSRPDIYDTDTRTNPSQTYTNTTIQILFESYKDLLLPATTQGNPVISIPNYAKQQSVIADLKVEKKKIIYLSRVDRLKGLEFLINSFKTVADKYKDWTLDIYGQSQPPSYVAELEDLVTNLNLDKQIIFRGITDKPIETFREYDFCVFPSYFEGFPMGLIEAQSVGLPCIGLEGCSGVNELIIDGYNGFLCKEDYTEFGQKIEKLILDRDVRIQFGANSVKNASIYNQMDVFKCWLDVIEQILSGKAPKSFDKYPQSDKKYKLFELSKIMKFFKTKKKLKFYQKIFSITNDDDRKIVYVLGIKFSIKRKGYNNA